MGSTSGGDPDAPITRYLAAARDGDPEAIDQLYRRVYAELQTLARAQLRRQSGGTLHTTELVHETYLRLRDQVRLGLNDRAHFFAITARAMRRVLIDHFRKRRTAKRGGGVAALELDPGRIAVDDRGGVLLELDHALDGLAELDPRLGRVVECKFFGGMTEEEIGSLLEVTPRTVRSDWRRAKAWLARELGA